MWPTQLERLPFRLLSLVLAFSLLATSACGAQGVKENGREEARMPPVAQRPLHPAPSEQFVESERGERLYTMTEQELNQLEADIHSLERINADLATALAAANAEARAYRSGAIGCLLATTAITIATVAFINWR